MFLGTRPANQYAKEEVVMKIRLSVVGLCCLIITLLAAPLSFSQSQRHGNVTIEEDPLEDRLPPGIKVRAFIHRPRVVEPNHLGTCTQSTTDSTEYGLTGWHLPARIITWKLSESTIPAGITASDARTAINNSFTTCSPFAFPALSCQVWKCMRSRKEKSFA